VGQERELNLELWSTGVSFGDQLFVLPEVKGGFLMQSDSSTVKLNETRGNIQWQGLRYTLLFFPQRAGRLEVPPFDVQFSARAGFGSQPSLFRRQTPGIFIDARLPPGVDSGGLLVSTGSFSMEATWTPRVPADGPAELKVGDYLKLEVTREAQDVPGMVFAPLPDFSIAGLAAYPDSPQVNDRINRGSLTSKRTDGVTFICQREGSYTIPEMRFQWWDPGQEVLAEKVIPALELVVTSNPAYLDQPGVAGVVSQARRFVLDWKYLLAAVVSLVALVYLARRARPYLDPAILKTKRAELRAFSVRLFRRVIKAPNGLPPLNPPAVKKDS
jgi:hypothetical protein